MFYSELVGSRKSSTIFYKNKDKINVVCGCFKGNFTEFIDKVKKSYKIGNKYRTQYDVVLEQVKRLWNVNENETVKMKGQGTMKKNVTILDDLDILGDIRQAMGATSEVDTSCDKKINSAKNSDLIGYYCQWNLGSCEWWFDMKNLFDQLETTKGK